MEKALKSLITLSVLLVVCLRPLQSQSNVLEEDAALTLQILRDESFARLNQLGKISDAGAFLQRTFLSPAAMRAINVLQEWMQDAGLYTWVDQIGNVHGRSDGANPAAPALLMGSHMDTVVDAGKYDGALGIITAIAAVKALHKQGKLSSFPRPIEVIAFSDEEGIRFQSTFLGSGAIAGVLPPELLYVQDKSGLSLASSLQGSSFQGTAESLLELKYDPQSVWGYIEAHIEQGPVLEANGIPLGVVEVIAGQTRLQVKMRGSQGHAGTVPMAMRRDPMPGAAQGIVAIEQLCKDNLALDTTSHSGSLVCTVGAISSWPGASNVIPGEVVFTIDVRAKEDRVRHETVAGIHRVTDDICKDRRLSCTIEKMHEANSVNCDQGLTSELKRAAEMTVSSFEHKPNSNSVPGVPSLMSGAGHDAMAMAQLTKVGMIFVRCAGGISHSPLENVMEDDVMAAGLSILHFLRSHMEQHLVAIA